MADLISKLLPHEKRDLLDFWSNYDLQSPLEQVLARVWAAEDASTESLILSWMHRNPHWSRDHVRIVLGFDRLHQNIALGLATARRIELNDPAELAWGRCLEARLTWLMRRILEQSGEGTADVDLTMLSMALGVRDEPLATHLMAPLPASPEKDRITIYIEQALAACFNRDREALGHAVAPLRKLKIDRYRRYLGRWLVGMADENAAEVSGAIQQAVDEERVMRLKKQHCNIVNIEAHDIYRMTMRQSPNLASGFDVRQDLPWDAEYHLWLEAHSEPLQGLDLSSLPSEAREVLVDLRLPSWFRALSPPESPFDECDLIVEDFGAAPEKVREFAETLSRMRGWPPIDLSKPPATFATKIPRHLAALWRARLRECGAGVRIESS